MMPVLTVRRPARIHTTVCQFLISTLMLMELPVLTKNRPSRRPRKGWMSASTWQHGRAGRVGVIGVWWVGARGVWWVGVMGIRWVGVMG